MFKRIIYVLAILAPVFAQQVSPTINQFPSRQFGQPSLPAPGQGVYNISPNLVEGRELWTPFGIAIDTNATPPILYVADTGNNRVLVWKNANSLSVCGLNNPGCGFADIPIGQRDMYTTLAAGPGRNGGGLSIGFTSPMALAVDANGNLYVADVGNNRILRFPSPTKQNGSLLQPDLVIGQKTANSGIQPNEGNQVPSAKTLSLQSGLVTSMAFDSSGGLWVPDPGNNRVLRFPANQLTAGTIEPAADIVMGQLDFQTSSEMQAPAGSFGGNQFFKQNLAQPSAVAIAPNGAMYIADAHSRVLYYLPGIASGSTGIAASRILGLGINLPNQPALTLPNSYQLASQYFGLAMQGSNLFVFEPAEHRVVKYGTPDTWPAEPNLTSGQTPTVQFSPPMIDVVGQNTLTSSNKANKGQAEASSSSLSAPIAGTFSGTDLWVADSSNNRVLSFLSQGGKYVTASRLVGQLDFPYMSPNLIEGREVSFSTNPSNAFAGIAIDNSSTPPHLYVADTNNNRILGFKDARNIGGTADMVIGQPDFYRSLINGGTNDPQLPNQSGLYLPRGLTVDAGGNLYVADSGNGRVLRFPAPFNQPAGSQQLPNLVLGQSSYSSQFFDASISSMAQPVGLAMFSDGSLAVSDVALNRVLIFKKQGNDFVNGQSASIVLGQADPNSRNPSSSAAGMSSPRQLAVDTSDRLYVADFGNSRLLVWVNGPKQITGASSSAQFNNLGGTQGVVVSPISGEIWVSNSSNNQIVALPEYNKLILNSTPNNYPVDNFIQAQTPAASVTLDANDNPIVAESANRLTFFYAAATYSHAASYNQKPMAPGMLALIYRLGKAFTFSDYLVSSFPWSTTANDLQVTVNGTPSPIYSISTAGGFIAFQIPSNAPTSGTAEFRVIHPSTGEIVAAGVFQMATSSPGFFTASATGSGQVAALNYKLDGTFLGVNSPSNPVPRDGSSFIAFCLTGAGVFSGGPDAPPADGMPPAGLSNTHSAPTVILGAYGGAAPAQVVLGSAAGCGFPGGWQINVKIDSAVFAATPNNVVAVTLDGNPSNIGPNGSVVLTFATK